MRSAVDALLAYNRRLPVRAAMARKLRKLLASPFGLFRGACFLFAADLRRGPFSRIPLLPFRGLVVGDVHTENFGSYRAVTGEIVYDINDFDDATEASYESDLRRLAVSLVLAALENHYPLGDAVHVAEAAIRSWLQGLRHWAKYTREEFAAVEPRDPVRQLLQQAGERNRAEFLRRQTAAPSLGRFSLARGKEFGDVTAEEAKAVARALPRLLASCLAPANADLGRYRLQDVATRAAGAGSLGRTRYALLLDKGTVDPPGYPQLRLLECKHALDSAFDTSSVMASPGRACQVFRAALTMTLAPKRYLGHGRIGGAPFQLREIGANDDRFSHRLFALREGFEDAAVLFGGILARAHLLGSPGGTGPGAIPQRLPAGEDRFVHRLLSFACDYAGQVYDDFAELERRQEEVRDRWSR